MDTTNVIKKIIGIVLFLGGVLVLSYLYFYKKDLSAMNTMWCCFAIALGAKILSDSYRNA